jgi:glyoxylase-like metal-dependent hydrolase (beta-lactamase superfamily II)
MELAPGIEALGDARWGYVRAFLIDDGNELTLVDTLGEPHPFTILAAIRRMGRSIADLKRVCLTHAHFSHLGGLIALKELSGAEIYSHAWEADIIAGEREAQRVPLLPRRPVRVYYPFQLGAAIGKGASGAGEDRFGGCPVDGHLTDGQVLGPVKVIHAPGHTPGHLAFWVESQGVLLAGDAIVTWPRLAGGWDSFTLNEQQQRESLRKLADYAPEKVGVGHGGAIVSKTADVVKSLVNKA